MALHRGSFTVFLALSVSLRTESLGHGGTPRAVCLHCSTFLSYPASGSRGQASPCALVGAGRRRIDGEDADTHNPSAGGAKEEEYIRRRSRGARKALSSCW